MAITGKRRQAVVLTGIIAAGLILGIGLLRPDTPAGGADSQTGTFTVRRGDLTMSVSESGTIKARNAIEIESKVEGQATIVSVVSEGTFITNEDVANGKVLVELDSSKLRDEINQQKITFNSAEADYTEAKESLTIQKNQNDSDIQQGTLKVKFAKMDLQKYLGSVVADVLIDDYRATGQIPTAAILLSDPNQLGGASQQKLRELQSDIKLAQEEYERAQTDLGWTQKLFDKDYVSKSDLDSDKLKVNRLRINWERSQTALDLFKEYDFPKEAEKLFSDYLEAERELQRIQAKTRSQLAQAEARLSSSEAKYLLHKERLERIEGQIEACVMRATEPGMVIYASNSQRRWGNQRTSIEVGAEVYERQLILTIMNAEEMDVDVKIHETNVDKVRTGQPVKIVIDAQPDKVFTGKVLKVSPLPDPQNFLGNPDLKIYSTDVSLEGADASIKPGFSARVEVLIAELTDVLSIPVQCVANRGGQKVCFLDTPTGPKAQVVETGAFNDRFVQIRSGLKEGQSVLLNPPRLLMHEEDKSPKRKKSESDRQAKPRPERAP